MTDDEVWLRPRESWTDWFDSDLLVAAAGLSAILLAGAGLVVGGVGGTVLLVLAAVLGLGFLGYVLAGYAAMAYVVVRGAVLLLSRGGRARLKRGAVDMMRTLDTAGHDWRIARTEVTAVSPVDRTLRPRLRLMTRSGEVVLRTWFGRRKRLEGLAWALAAR